MATTAVNSSNGYGNVERRRLEGKVAIITGGASGLGEATARVFVYNGAKVVIADMQNEKGLKLCDELGHSNASFVQCDVTKESDVENVVNSTISIFEKLDIMFNNAGTTDTPKLSILDNDLSDFKKVIDVNLVGVFLGIKHAARAMIPNGAGVIINTSSTCSVMGGGSTHAYTSSKCAVARFTRNTAVELGRYGIRVNCIFPYFVPTPLTLGLGTFTEDDINSYHSHLKGANLCPNDIAEAALYLASDESKFGSGHNLVVDGGVTNFRGKYSMFETL